MLVLSAIDEQIFYLKKKHVRTAYFRAETLFMTQTILNGDISEEVPESKRPEVLHFEPEQHLFDNHLPKFSFHNSVSSPH